MIIALDVAGKKFGREWIFRKLSYTFEAGKQYAVIGHNGSGKSTLLKLLSGSTPPSEGKISYFGQNGKEISIDSIYAYMAIVAPYTAVIEDFTLSELLRFYRNFKKISLEDDAFAQKIALSEAKSKPIKHYSSGMKQRLQLALAMYSESAILLLDEPSNNLDQKNTQWFQQEIAQPMPNRIVIISSNQPHEYEHCEKAIDMLHWKL